MTLEQLVNPDVNALLANPLFLTIILVTTAWKFAWYGAALWKTVEDKNKKLFVVFFALMMVLNDVGLVPIVYLAYEKYKKAKPKKK
jgi:hypothetical protein